jgi:hypothetical protein
MATDSPFVWLSAQGAAPVYVKRALLTNGMMPHFTRSFDGVMALPPRIPALEKTIGEPVYLIDVPPSILTVLLNILAHPQLKYHYSADKSGGVESIVRREYLRYYGAYSLKREVEDADEAEEKAATKARLEESAAYDAACLALYKVIEKGHPEWGKQFSDSPGIRVHAEFLVKYGEGDLSSDYLQVDDENVAIGWHFFLRDHKLAYRFIDIAKGQHDGVLVSFERRWDHTLAVGSRRVEHWPAVTRAKEVNAQHYEIVRVSFTSSPK